MALTTYAELQTAILSRMDRSDLTADVPDWIRVAEHDINRWLRTVWTEKRAYATPTSAFVERPSDYNGLRNVQWDYQGYRLPLEQVSPSQIDQIHPSTTTGVPQYFCVHTSEFELRPAPSGDNTSTIEIVYYFTPAALTDSNTSNEVLVNAPDLLFYRALAEGFDHLMDDARSVKYMQMYLKIKDDIMKDDVKSKWGDAPLRMTSDSMYSI